jgi:hypothetical protein
MHASATDTTEQARPSLLQGNGFNPQGREGFRVSWRLAAVRLQPLPHLPQP